MHLRKRTTTVSFHIAFKRPIHLARFLCANQLFEESNLVIHWRIECWMELSCQIVIGARLLSLVWIVILDLYDRTWHSIILLWLQLFQLLAKLIVLTLVVQKLFLNLVLRLHVFFILLVDITFVMELYQCTFITI